MTKLEVPDHKERYLVADLCATLETYLDPAQVKEVFRAFLLSAEAHEGQFRRSGEPYVCHPVAVAGILASMRMDPQTLIAALLHDVIEDTGFPKEQLVADFGEQVGDLVDGVSKLRNMDFASRAEAQAASFHKMIMAMIRDIRVIIVKLADRLHNMRTQSFMKVETRRRKARETLEIYAPIASRLCMGKICVELEDLGFAGLYPLRHRVIHQRLLDNYKQHRDILQKIEAAIRHRLEQHGIAANVQLIMPQSYEIYQNLRNNRNNRFKDLKDSYRFRVIVDSVDTCYRSLGAIHALYKPKPGDFKDCIAIPRANHYQALHTKVVGSHGINALEIQIYTWDMHAFSQYGITTEGLYKVNEESSDGCTREWVRSLMDLRDSSADSMEFLEHVKIDLFPDEIYIFTPKGKIIELPRGATVVDFAYAIHSDLGNHLINGKIDNKMAVSLHTVLRTGQTVEIFTANWASPKPGWLDFAVTAKARSHIRKFLKKLNHEQAKLLGQRIFDKELERYGLSVAQLSESQHNALLSTFKFRSLDDLLADIGLGNHLAYLIVRQLNLNAPETSGGEAKTDLSPVTANTPLFICGTEGMVITLAKCCRPIPGDAIKGYVSPGKGIVVHTDACKNAGGEHRNRENWLSLAWQEFVDGEFPVDVRAEVKNERGVLGKIATALGNFDINIENVSSETKDGASTLVRFCIQVRHRKQLADVLRGLRRLDTVLKVQRR